MLKPFKHPDRIEAGCDEAGRGCLAGPVVAACVVLPEGYSNEGLDDSKRLSPARREQLRVEVERDAAAWAVVAVEAPDIDRLNILHASTHAMCQATLAVLGQAEAMAVHTSERRPTHLLIDGNRFYNETPLTYECIVKGDAQYMSIAAASILAKTYRDAIMQRLDAEFPGYGWSSNKGYPTADHYTAIERLGLTPQHRRSFALYRQKSLFD